MAYRVLITSLPNGVTPAAGEQIISSVCNRNGYNYERENEYSYIIYCDDEWLVVRRHLEEVSKEYLKEHGAGCAGVTVNLLIGFLFSMWWLW